MECYCHVLFVRISPLLKQKVAYHFEINARKDFVVDGELKIPDINSNYDYSRSRSRRLNS